MRLSGTIKMAALIATFISLAACSKKTFLERSDEEAALRDAVRKLNKNPSNEEAADAIPVLYKNIKTTRLARIKSYSSSVDMERWDRIINEYENLQQVYTLIINSTQAFRLVTPESYSVQIRSARDSAASGYYKLGMESLGKEGRANSKRAFDYFNTAEKYSPGFKDAENKATEAFNKAIVYVVVGPLSEPSGVIRNNMSGNVIYRSNEFFQENLVRELGGNNNSKIPARYYLSREMIRDSSAVIWTVETLLKNLDIPNPVINTYSRSVNKQIQMGTDTAGKPVTKTVFATINVTQTVYTAQAEMNVRIKDSKTGMAISSNDITEDYRLEQESANFAGDQRALSTADWDLINNTGKAPPTNDFIKGQLYKKLIPKAANLISSTANW